MKFTKEQALEKLKDILTNGGKKTLRMSEKSIGRQLEVMIPLLADDETELDAFIEKVKTSFEVMNSNVEKDNSDFVSQWKKEHPKTDDKKTGDDDKKETPESKELKELLERMKKLEERNAAAEREKSIGQKKSELKKKMKEKGITNDEWSDLVLSEISISEDLDVDAKADSLLKLFNKQKSSVVRGVAPLGTSKGEDGKGGLFDDLKKELGDKSGSK